jgi:hypothetical protein
VEAEMMAQIARDKAPADEKKPQSTKASTHA